MTHDHHLGVKYSSLRSVTNKYFFKNFQQNTPDFRLRGAITASIADSGLPRLRMVPVCDTKGAGLSQQYAGKQD
jgi:hypothetical protein